MKSVLKYIAFALMAFLPLSQLDAKGSSGGGRSSFSSRSSSSSFSRSTPSPSVSKPSSGFSSKPSVSKPSSGFSSKPSAVKPSTSTAPKNAFDKSQAARYVAPPPPIKPKNEYISDFKKNNASKYPTKFSSPPATRPSYIPQATPAGQPIIYNQAAGGYGFMDGLGQFMIYDAITDIASNAFKDDEKVYVQQTKEYDAALKQQQQVVAQQADEGWTGLEIFLTVLVVAFVIFIFIGYLLDDRY
jgi:hypothetical protein